MKIIALLHGTRPYTTPDGTQPQFLSSLGIFRALVADAAGGLDLDQLRLAVRLLNELDVHVGSPESSPTVLLLENDIYEYLVTKLRAAKWSMVDPFLVEVIDAVLNAVEPPPAPETAR
jgi:hypothetical protein